MNKIPFSRISCEKNSNGWHSRDKYSRNTNKIRFVDIYEMPIQIWAKNDQNSDRRHSSDAKIE